MSPRSDVDGDAQPLNCTVKLRFSRRQLAGIDALAGEIGMSRSWFLREALALGVPAASLKIRTLIQAGYRPHGERIHPNTTGIRRGPYSDGPRPDRWVLAPEVPLPRGADIDPGYEEE